MPINSLVLELLEEITESGRSAEDVCKDRPELLGEVRACLRQLSSVRDELDALFPEDDEASSSPSSSPQARPEIPGYNVGEILGRGGMGVVYKARHLRLNRPVAVKMMLNGSFAGPAELARFHREAEALAALRHPNIVQVHDIGESGELPYFTMEFVDGGNLAQKLGGVPQPARAAANLMVLLAGAVEAAHRGGIVHRDLKPANILLTADGTPKISDFGLARRFEQGVGLSMTGVRIGTPGYMAPEQVAGHGRVSGSATDVYALGAILYEMLTGRPPFLAETVAETERQVIAEEPAPPTRLNVQVPRDLETICLKCLRKEPHLRYAGAAALAEDLSSFLRGEAIAARPDGRLERLVRRVRRRPVISAVLTVGTLLTVTLTVGGLWLIYDRAVVAREVEAEQAAKERAADEDLQEMDQSLEKSSWSSASSALERAKVRLGDRGTDAIRRRVEQGTRDLALALRLDPIRLGKFSSEGFLDFTKSDELYSAAFRSAELGQIGDPVEVVVARVGSARIRETLVAALDDWAACVPDASSRSWLLTVARKADPHPTAWSVLARDPLSWENNQALLNLSTTAPANGQSVPLLLAIQRRRNARGEDPIPFLKRIQKSRPDDPHANFTLGYMLMKNKSTTEEAIGYLRAALALQPGSIETYNFLSIALMNVGRSEDALNELREALRVEPSYSKNPVNHCNFFQMLTYVGRHDEAIGYITESLKEAPHSAPLHEVFGECLKAKGKYTEAIAEYRQAVELDPKLTHAQIGLRTALMRLGQLEESRVAWYKALAIDPPAEHPAWYGYAEFCLFLGREEEYLRARRSLLARFSTTADPFVAERTSRACLLRAVSGDELKQAVELAARAAAVDRSDYPAVYHAFAFVKGLAEYRQGQYDLAISTMSGDASRALGPTPRLVIAMAQHRNGRVAEARKTLAAAISTHDWRIGEIRDQDGWICHVFRREAERLILPDMPALLDGSREPRDNDERLAMLGDYLFTNRFHDSARLYADAFDADRELMQDLGAAHRYNAARTAALAGCGHGRDAPGLGEAEGKKWRDQAMQWLRAELAARIRALDTDPTAARLGIRQALTRWQKEPDLACVRDAGELEKLPAGERKECLGLWAEVAAVLARTQK